MFENTALIKNIIEIMSLIEPILGIHQKEIKLNISDKIDKQNSKFIIDSTQNHNSIMCEILLFVLSSLFADASNPTNEITIYDDTVIHSSTTNKIESRIKLLSKTKEKVGRESLVDKEKTYQHDRIEYLNSEVYLLFHEKINLLFDKNKDKCKTENNKKYGKINPLIKLANAQNFNDEHFSTDNLTAIFNYYKDISSYVERCLSFIDQIMLIYDLELELRFGTNIKLLNKLNCSQLDESKLPAFDGARSLTALPVLLDDDGICTERMCQNKIYHGIDNYITAFTEVLTDNITEDEKLSNINMLILSMSFSNCYIYRIGQAVISVLKNKYKDEYSEYGFKVYQNLKSIDINFVLSNIQNINFLINERIEKLYSGDDRIEEYKEYLICFFDLLQKINETKEWVLKTYKTMNSGCVTNSHFLRLYIPDDKMDKYIASQITKKEHKKQHKKQTINNDKKLEAEKS